MNYLLDREGGNAQWLIWLDADSVTYEPITLELLGKTFNDEADVTFLGRKNAYATCSSLIGFKLTNIAINTYTSAYGLLLM